MVLVRVCVLARTAVAKQCATSACCSPVLDVLLSQWVILIAWHLMPERALIAPVALSLCKEGTQLGGITTVVRLRPTELQQLLMGHRQRSSYARVRHHSAVLHVALYHGQRVLSVHVTDGIVGLASQGQGCIRTRTAGCCCRLCKVTITNFHGNTCSPSDIAHTCENWIA